MKFKIAILLVLLATQALAAPMPGYEVYGKITVNENPVPNANVVVSGSQSGQLWSGISDSKGWYGSGLSLRVIDGETITVEASYGAASGKSTGTARYDSARIDVELSMEGAATTIPVTTTVSPGVTTIPTTVQETTIIVVKPAVTTTVEPKILLPGFEVYGKITDQNGNLIKNAEVVVIGSASGQLWSGVSKADGWYTTTPNIRVNPRETINVRATYKSASGLGLGSVEGSGVQIDVKIPTVVEEQTTTPEEQVTTKPSPESIVILLVLAILVVIVIVWEERRK